MVNHTGSSITLMLKYGDLVVSDRCITKSKEIVVQGLTNKNIEYALIRSETCFSFIFFSKGFTGGIFIKRFKFSLGFWNCCILLASSPI